MTAPFVGVSPSPSRRTSSHRRSSSRDGYGASGDGRQRRTRASATSTSLSSSSSLSNEWRAHEEQQAARVVQRAVRAHLSRRRLARLVRRVYDKQLDPVSQRVFYVNLLTNESSWEPPALLVRFGKARDRRAADGDDNGDERDELLQGIPKRGAWQALSTRDAAERIQRLARAFVARKQIRALVRELYMKLLDPATRTFYYLNTRTGATCEDKPPFFRRRRDASAAGAAKKQARPAREDAADADIEIERFFFRQAVCKLSTATAASASGALGRFCGRLCLLCAAEAMPSAEAAQAAHVTCNYAPERVPFPVLLASERFFATVHVGSASGPAAAAFVLCAVDDAQFAASTGGNVPPLLFEENDRKLGCVGAVDGVIPGDAVEVVSHPASALQSVRTGRATGLSPNSINPQRVSLDLDGGRAAVGRGGVVFTRGGKLVGLQQLSGDFAKRECWTMHAILATAAELLTPPAPLLLTACVSSTSVDAYWHLPRRWRPQRGLSTSFELELCALSRPDDAVGEKEPSGFQRVYAGARASSHVGELLSDVVYALRCRTVTGMRKSPWSESARVRTLARPSMAWRLLQCTSVREAVARLKRSSSAGDVLAVFRSVQWLSAQLDKAGAAERREEDGDDRSGVDKRLFVEEELASTGGLDALLALVSASHGVVEGKGSDNAAMTTAAVLLATNVLTALARLRQQTLRWLARSPQALVLCELLQRLVQETGSHVVTRGRPANSASNEVAHAGTLGDAGDDRPSVQVPTDEDARQRVVVAVIQLLGVVADGSASAAHTCIQLGDVVTQALTLLTPPHAGAIPEAVASESCCLLAKLAFQHDAGKWAILRQGGIPRLCGVLDSFRGLSSSALYWALLAIGNVAFALPPNDSEPEQSAHVDALTSECRTEFDVEGAACALVTAMCSCRAHYLTRLHELELELTAARVRLDFLLAMAMGEEARNALDAAEHEVATLSGAISDWKREDVAQAADYALRYVLTEHDARVQHAATRVLRKFMTRRLEMALTKWIDATMFDRQRAIISRMLSTVMENQLRPAFRRWEQLVSQENRQRKSASILYAIGTPGLAIDLGRKKRERYRMLVLQK